MKPASSGSKRAAPASKDLRVAYHDGPPEIHFAGLPWRRGVADTVTPALWEYMQSRSDFNQFDFRPEPAQQEPEKPAESKED